MNYLSIDHLIVGGFLLLTLLIGLWAGRGIKDIREYAIANRMYGTGVLTITFLATFLGGDTTIGVQKPLLSYGLIAGLTVIGSAIMLIYSGAFIVPRMVTFKDSITVGDLMKIFYGSSGGIITGIIGFVYTVSLVGAQILAIGYVCESLAGWRADWSTGLGGVILILYASVGGVKSVTITDIFQFIVFVIVIPLIANIAISEAGGIKELFRQVPIDKLTIYKHEQAPVFLTFFIWCLLPSLLAVPPITQRVLMARDKRQVTNMFFISAAFLPVVRVLLILTCLSILVLSPSIRPTSGGAFTYVIDAYFSPLLRGLSVAGILAIIMSTTDSFLNAGGLLFTHNVIKPLYEQREIAINELKITRYITLLIGGLGLLTAFHAADVRALGDFGMSILSPILTIPLIAGILGLKTDTRSFLIASLITITTFILAHLFLPAATHYLVFPISLVANAISFFGAHIIKNKGIATVKRQGEESELWRPSLKNTSHILFAFFVCFNYMVPYFMYTRQGETTMFTIRLIGATLCVGLLLKPYWGDWLKKYFRLYWYFSLLYCLPFATTTLYVLNGGGTEWTVNIALAIMLLIILVNWKSFIIISLSGIGLGILYCKGILGTISLSYENTYTLVYTSLFSTLIGLIFARRKEQRAARQQRALKAEGEANQTTLLQTAEERDKALQTLQSTGVQGLLQVAKDLQALPVEGEVAQKLHTIEATLIPMAFQLQGIDTRAQDYLRLQVASVPMKQWLTTVQEELRDRGIYQPIRCQQTTQHKELVCDPERLTTLLIKSIAALGEQTEGHQEEEQPLLLGLEDTWLHYPLPDVAEGYVKKVEALRMVVTTEDSLPALTPCYWPDLTTSAATAPENTQALDQRANERIIKAHYGYAEVEPNTLLYVIPIDVKEVRPKGMDKRHMELGEAPVRANDHYKSDKVDAQAQEKEFLAAVEARSRADIGLVKTALELIKWYHGPVNRHSGEPFYLHPLSVAQIVLDYNTDEATILGALLHDTVEDTMMFLQHIGTVFGAETAGIVDVVTHLQSVENSLYKIRLSAKENLQMLERTGNTRGLYVKLADRMHNMRTIGGHSSLAKQKQIAQETLAFFVPLAKRLGLHEAAQELEERSREVLMKGTH